MRYARLLLIGGLLSPGSYPAEAASVDLAPPRSLLPVDAPTAPVRACPQTCEVEIEGTVVGNAPIIVVLRFDDPQSSGYASRVNEERILQPGPFRWRKSLFGLRTVNGRVIYQRQISRMMLFVGRGEGRVELASLKLNEVPPLPSGAIGLSFGHVEAPILAGFERVGSTDPRLAGQIFNIRHPSPDPLIATGMRGIKHITQAWPSGRARVSLWTEDPGEWENLPHPLGRRIVVNGVEVLRQNFTPPQWMRQRYLAGSDREPDVADPWLAFGQYRGGLVTAEVDVGDDGVNVDLEGDSPAGMFLSAMLVEPAGQRAALDYVQGLRARWYREGWPIGEPQLQQVAHEVSADLDKPGNEPPLKLTLAPGTGGRALVSVSSSITIAEPKLVIEAPRNDNGMLRLEAWAAQRQLDRTNFGSTLLALKDDRLRAATARFPIRPGAPRRYPLWVSVPDDASPGLYRGKIAIGAAGRMAEIPIEIEVLAIALPPAAKPAGFFHDEAPHLRWFAWPGDLRRRQIVCDLATLAAFGLVGNPPALSTPYVNRNDEIVRDVQSALQGGDAAPLMAYSPVPRAIAEQGIDGSIESIADAEQRIADKGFAPLLWSVADEPSNPDLAGGDLPGFIRKLRAVVPGIRLAAHLNNKADRPLVPLFDVAIVNAGYGIDRADLEAIAKIGVEPWLYNTDALRFTAGLWLWATPARHYIQWHARLPTADPFDPTDGRESDAQVFYPSMEICPTQPDLNARVMEMAEGVVDQRWLQWLSGREEPEANALAASIRAEIGQAFAVAAKFDDAKLATMRERIVDYARTLKQK